jgi:NO-binding membrane sensor protein with MHYT domain
MVTNLWILGGSIAMGAGIWSMHFIGMLAFTMPDMPMAYSAFWTGASMVVAIGASAFALFLLRPKNINSIHMAIGGIILGLAIASMHYVGMYAMTISMNIHYWPGLFTLSIIIAIVASEVALVLAIKSNEAVSNIRFRMKFFSALIMGAAICGMHYTGMAAAVFTPLADESLLGKSINPEYLSVY